MSPKNVKSEIAINLIFALIKSIAMLMVVRIAGMEFTPFMLGIFLLSRRASNTGANLFQFGMSQTLQRYVSLNLHNKLKYIYILFALIIWIITAALTFPIIYFYSDLFSIWLFPNLSNGEDLALWTLSIIVIFSLHYIIYSTLLAERKIFQANILELLNSSGILLLIFILSNNPEVDEVIKWQAIFMLMILLCYAITALFKVSFVRIHRGVIKEVARNFLYYGATRGVITFLDMLFLMISPWLLRYSLEQSGYLLIALTMFNMILTIIMPISQIVSLSAARILNQDPSINVKKINWMFGSLLYTSTILIVLILPWCKEILMVWLGEEQLVEGTYPYLLLILLCILPFTLYRGMKGLIEILWDKPYNLYSLVCAILVHIVTYYILEQFISSIDAVKISLLMACCSLALITIITIYSHLSSLRYFGASLLLKISIAIFGVNLLGGYLFNSIIIGLLFIMVTLLSGLYILYLLRPPFVVEVMNYLIPKRLKNEVEHD
ncbi:MATE family efflux transporter [Cohnella cholangitidis]|uniref:O-antigen/teichoic acid export membrane protein n=1 Tax=Cohnella cholangitidis TaxID=2598458 RepID=A0A7G5BXN6_9BACL|nr:hypothetical protein [Cohnella cholangitidis]QMV41720.1 hypothetical protein FPL14_11380 [Cohnella cholangitidis]